VIVTVTFLTERQTMTKTENHFTGKIIRKYLSYSDSWRGMHFKAPHHLHKVEMKTERKKEKRKNIKISQKRKEKRKPTFFTKT